VPIEEEVIICIYIYIYIIGIKDQMEEGELEDL
jgi:hypothetical protein